MQKISVAILGASGYTGVEVLRLLAMHAFVQVKALSANRQAGKHIVDIFPNLTPYKNLPILQTIEEIDFTAIDVVFCCLPHAETQQVVAALPENIKIIDLSADFRLADTAVYEKWYGKHYAPHLQAQAVYGLTEWAREKVQGARLVANPGCYPTASLLPLMPLLQQQIIENDSIIIDAKSGVSGAGRALREGSLAAEVAEGIHAYGVGGHRHLPEIEQGCSKAAEKPIQLTFTPHLLPCNRGILATIYAKLAENKTVAEAHRVLSERYRQEQFISVLPLGASPATRYVRGSNSCQIGVFPDNRAGHVIIVSVIDNLVKGASGQAIQNMNVMFGFPEEMGLPKVGMFP